MTTAQGSAAPQSRNVVICLDGTDNQFGRHNTNVVRVFQSLQHDPQRQIGYYDPGVGTIWESGTLSRVSQKIQMLLGMAFGLGVSRNVAQAYAFLMRHYRAGDGIFIFGFSRGALEARALAGLVHRCGLLDPQLTSLEDYALRLFKSPGNEAVLAEFKMTFSQQIEIDFLGLWDTVTSMGNVWSPIYWPFTTRNPSVKRVAHAIAIDERRSFFRQNRWTAVASQQVSEMWFAGVHSDIGGGYPASSGRLWAITLEWMMEHACKPLHPGDAALILDSVRWQEIKTAGRTDPAAPDYASEQHSSLTWGWKPLELVPKPYREEQTDGSYKTRVMLPALHGGFRGRPRKLHPGEHVHRSAIERFVARSDYRPPTLHEAGLTMPLAHAFLAGEAGSWIVPA